MYLAGGNLDGACQEKKKCDYDSRLDRRRIYVNKGLLT